MATGWGNMEKAQGVHKTCHGDLGLKTGAITYIWHGKKKRIFSRLVHTPGKKVKKLYFWLLMTFRGYLWSLFSGCPNQTVRGLGSPAPQHLSHSQHLWKRDTPTPSRPRPHHGGHAHSHPLLPKRLPLKHHHWIRTTATPGASSFSGGRGGRAEYMWSKSKMLHPQAQNHFKK